MEIDREGVFNGLADHELEERMEWSVLRRGKFNLITIYVFRCFMLAKD